LFSAVPSELELGPAPCAFAKLLTAKNAALTTAASEILLINVSPLFWGVYSQCYLPFDVPSHAHEAPVPGQTNAEYVMMWKAKGPYSPGLSNEEVEAQPTLMGRAFHQSVPEGCDA
jgi:hypothetical protein